MSDWEERLDGIVERVTFHSPQTGWSILKVSPLRNPAGRVAVRVHQSQVFAGATMQFVGQWRVHPKYGEQFEARQALERKPASGAALERYLGSGLIHGVGPKTARKIVKHFGKSTLDVFEGQMDRLVEVPGIAQRKLEMIRSAWQKHRAVRDVMLFLQEYGVSTLFAVKIFKAYGNAAIDRVKQNPYALARDIYGIGFFSADRIAMALGFAPDSDVRLEAGIKHVLDASREQGHCYLTRGQVLTGTLALLTPGAPPSEALTERLGEALSRVTGEALVRTRLLPLEAVPPAARAEEVGPVTCYYAFSLYRAEDSVATWARQAAYRSQELDTKRVDTWLTRYCDHEGISLSVEQRDAVHLVLRQSFSILTGGPGCGKTTTTRAIVKLARAMGKRVLLAAPTGRAAQRMSEVIGLPAQTLHRLLEWDVRQGRFSRNAERPLAADMVVVDETSMLDITLAADLLAAAPEAGQVLFIGDPEQLPAVGAGNVLHDLLACPVVPRAALTKVFRQAQASSIVRHAHAINHGEVPQIPTPLADPTVWRQAIDCLFIDAEEATQEQLRFIRRAKAAIAEVSRSGQEQALVTHEGRPRGYLRSSGQGVTLMQAKHAAEPSAPVPGGLPGPPSAPTFIIPRKFLHVDWSRLAHSQSAKEELQTVLRRLHPHSALHRGLSALDVITRLYVKTLADKLGPGIEVQVLTPMQRGSLGALALNSALQAAVNPPAEATPELKLGERVFRVGDRVIQRRNNYDSNVFNGDIGRITGIDPAEATCIVHFGAGERAQNVTYRREDLAELALAYAITIHKSQGSEFPAVIIPITTQHYSMLFRNLVYTALTRAKKMAVFVGTRAALDMAVHNVDARARQTALAYLLGGA